jgi:hypothetical protein
MPTFKKLSDLEKYIKGQIPEILKQDVAPEVIETMKEHIQTDVYDAYSPTAYVRRREDGGLLDDDNFSAEMVSEDTLKVKNTTTDSENKYKDIVPIIEYGVGYTWEKSRIYQSQPYPRPFVRNTRQELKEGRLKEIIAKSLKKRFSKTKD